MLIAKEMLEFIHDHLDQIQIDYLMGEIDLDEAARLSGVSCDAFRKRLERGKRDFKDSVRLMD